MCPCVVLAFPFRKPVEPEDLRPAIGRAWLGRLPTVAILASPVVLAAQVADQHGRPARHLGRVGLEVEQALRHIADQLEAMAGTAKT